MFLGIDLGTSSLKAVVIDYQHQVRATAEADLTVSHPNINWSEQNPADWEQALIQVCSGLASQIPLHQVERIGLTGQMHGATCLDEKGSVLRPCLLWNDGRASDECLLLNQQMEQLTAHSGNLAMPGFTAPKLMWLKRHEPEVFHRIRQVLLPKDYLRWLLTGVFATDPSDASGTLWMNPETRQWDDTLIEMTDAQRNWLPHVFEGPEETGSVTTDASRKYGLPRVPVVAGGGDNACGALALGICQPGQTLISLGTSGVIFTVSEAHQACPEKTVHAFAHAVPDRWHQMTVTLSAAHSLTWLSTITGQSVTEMVNRVSVSNQTETEV
ncbi:MAG: xylulokinase, partial [Oceanospirillales bacterium]|nr:xylulokinase [Oceanospirillales bacterium]